MSFNTGNPVPSKDYKDFRDNCENLDTLLHSEEESWVDRTGEERPTIRGLEAQYAEDYTVVTQARDTVVEARNETIDAKNITVEARGYVDAAKEEVIAAKDDVLEAKEEVVSGKYRTVYTYSRAEAILAAAELGDGATVWIDSDEANGGVRTRNAVLSGNLVSTVAEDAARTQFVQAGGDSVARSVEARLREQVSVADKSGLVGDGVVIDDDAMIAALAVRGVVFIPPGVSVALTDGAFSKVGANNYEPYTLVVNGSTYIADESFDGEGAIIARRTTSTNKDAINAEHYGTGTGYALHGISYAANGSGVGGACWGIGAGVVGNKRGDGAGAAGNGVFGARWHAGNGSGVAGVKHDTGEGNGGQFENDGAGYGAGVLAWRKAAGNGPGVYAIREGSGFGAAVDGLKRDTDGEDPDAGDGGRFENTSSAPGHGVSVFRRVGESTKSLGYLAYYDVGTGESAGVYGAVIDGAPGFMWGGRFDGPTRTSGTSWVGGASAPLVDNEIGSTLGFADHRWSNAYSVNLRPGNGTAIWTTGNGSPEGAVSAVVGSLYTRVDGGAGTTLYVKESGGGGNTGWVAK